MSGQTGNRAKRRAQGRRDRLGRAAPPDQGSGSVSTLFVAAAQHHQSGRLAEAEALYRQILELDPGHVESLHNLGVLAQQTRRYPMAEDLIGRAITLNGRIAHFHQSLADTLRIQGKLDEAAARYRRAIELKPDFAQAHYNLALALNGQDKLAEAASSYRRAIAVKPDFAEAHNNLGALLTDQGRPDEAEASCRRAIDLRPDFAHAHFNLALALNGQDKLAEAASSYRRTIDLKPDIAEAHNNLGAFLKDQGKLDEAAASCRRAIALKPDYAEAHNNLGNVLRAQGEFEGAAASYQRAIDLKPGFAKAHYNLGNVLRNQGKLEEAAASYRRAIALKPDFAEAYNNLGNALMGRGRIEEAAVCLRQAAELEPGRAEIWFSLGRALAILGELGPARVAMLRAVELDPHAEEAIYTLAGLQPMNDGSREAEAAFVAVSRLANDLDQLGPDRRPPALFAMAKALEARGEFESAFAFMARANAIVRTSLSFDVGDDERRMNTIAKVFDGPLLERLKNVGSASERPIFIFGMARSGTTLIEQILSAHPAVHGAGELLNLTNAIASSHGGSTYTASWVKALNGADCRALAQTYLDSLPPASPGQARITDKGLANFEHLGLIQLCLPRATIIHCLRDPRDVCLSCYGSFFRQGHKHAFDLVDLGRFWRAYDRLMAHWRAVLPPGRLLEVPYEEVVTDIETWARRVIAHCGLDWDDACLRFHESKREVHTASLAQVRRPIYASSVGRWRPFARHLGPLLDALGEPWSDEGRTI